MMHSRLHNKKGMTLIEMLVVAAMMGLVMTAVFAIYRTHQRTANVQDEVGDLQQNLAIAMDAITKDIRMSGYMLTSANPAIAGIPATGDNVGPAIALPAHYNIPFTNSDILTIRSAGTSLKNAKIAIDQTGLASAFTVDDAADLDPFNVNEVVTIIRPGSKETVGGNNNWFDVVSKDGATQTIKLKAHTGSSDLNKDYRRGDLIVPTDVIYPNIIEYCLGPDPNVGGCANGNTNCPTQLCLYRIQNNSSPEVIASYITDLQFSYIEDGNSATLPVDAPAVTNFSTIRAVRVTITGQTAFTNRMSGMSTTGGNTAPQVRQLQSTVELRNRIISDPADL